MKPVDRVLERLEGVRERDGNYAALCPAHDDREPSLSVSEGDDLRVLLKCFGGCTAQEVTEALGLEMSDLFEWGNGRGGGGASIPPKSSATLQPCTLDTYAEKTRLPVPFLRKLSLSDTSYMGRPAVRIPYLREGGGEDAVRFRVALEKSPESDGRFRWRKGSKPCLYGLWRLGQAREAAGYLFLVEGESDCHTLWYHGFPALGVPGASNWRNEWASELDGIEKAYAVVEPDQGGETFWERLAASSIRERLYRVELEPPDGEVKDVSELHLRHPEGFRGLLEHARSRAVPWLDIAESEAQAQARVAWAACEDLALAPNILELFEAALKRGGVAGEGRVANILYLALTSRLLTRIVSVAVKGPSSGGKSYLVEQVLRFFPESAYYALTAMSDRTLAYSEEPIKHRFLVLFEAAGMSGDFATYLIRSLLSEGRLRYETVEKTSEGLKPRLIEREGPTGLIVTTTAVKLHPENETRLLSLTVNDTQEQTRDVLTALAEEDGEVPDLKPWQALQEWLVTAEHRVQIPYAKVLAELIPPVAVRLRRDFPAVLNLIRAHAVLHQATRAKDEQGRIVASIEDYAAVRRLVAKLVSEGVEAAVPKTIRETVEAAERVLRDSDGETVTVAAVARELKLENSTTLRRVRAALDRGHLKNLEDRRGRPARLVLGDSLPEDIEVLPSVERLQGCTVALETEGIGTPPPPSANETASEAGGRERFAL